MGIFTNIQTLYGNSNNISKFTSSTDISDLNSLTEPYTTAIIVNLFLICTLSIFGNILTLIAIPYVRLNYRSEFSILQINSVILILHLAFCDLLYAIVGFPHLILVYWTKTDIYASKTCYFLGAFRNLIAYADFNNIAFIACCVARQNLCGKCVGRILSHDEHDPVFGGKKVYIACLATWLSAFLALLPDIIGRTGQFGWTGSTFGCDTLYTNNNGPVYNHIINLCAVIIFYSTYIFSMFVAKYRASPSASPQYSSDQALSIFITLLLLTIAYIAFMLPLYISGSYGFAEDNLPITTQACLASWYWWIYGVNFIIYLTTNKRIRAAFGRFFRDIRDKIYKSAQNEEDEISSNFWLPMRNME